MGFYAVFWATFVGFPKTLLPFWEGEWGITSHSTGRGRDPTRSHGTGQGDQGDQVRERGRCEGQARRGSELATPRPVIPGQRRIGLSGGSLRRKGPERANKPLFIKIRLPFAEPLFRAGFTAAPRGPASGLRSSTSASDPRLRPPCGSHSSAEWLEGACSRHQAHGRARERPEICLSVPCLEGALTPSPRAHWRELVTSLH